MSKDTKDNLTKAKETTKNVLDFASSGVGKIVKFGKEVATDIG